MSQLTIVSVSDTHEDPPPVDEMPEGDVLIHAGDFTYTGNPLKVSEFNGWLRDVKHKYPLGIVVIPGNHDKTFDPDNHLARPDVVVPMLTHCTLLNDSAIEIGGFKFWGSPWTPSFGRNWAFNADRCEIKRYWDLIPDDTNVLITHGPPYKILDGVPEKRWLTSEMRSVDFFNHVGCYDLREAIKRVKPKLHVFGHIHEGAGAVEEDGTWFVNASTLNEYYDRVNKPVVITIKK